MNFSDFDHHIMREALQLAAKGKYSTSPNPRVGCILVKDQQIVGSGFHLLAGTAHAEIHALREAGGHSRDATAYVTLEPCSHYGRTPPCAQALIDHGIKKVIIATLDPNPLVAGNGVKMLKQAGIEVHIGLMQEEARLLNRGFFSRIERKRPFVKLKCATSLDGKIALKNGQSKWITSEASRLAVQNIRAESCAILTGIQTVLADDPQLTVRHFKSLRAPIRVIADTHLRTPLTAKILQQADARTIIATSIVDQARHQPYLDLGVTILTVPLRNQRIDLSILFTKLAECEIGELMIEAGSTLNGALLQENLVDEIVWFQAAKILGDKGRSVFTLDELTSMADVPLWQLVSNQTIGQSDICLTLKNCLPSTI